METDKSKINGARFMFTIALFLQSSALLTAIMASITLQDSWLAIIFASVICIPIIFLYKAIMVKFPKHDFIEVLRIVFGNFFGNFIAILYMLFFILLTALNLNELGDFAKLTVMFNTPKIVLIVISMIVAVFAVRFGFGVVTRFSMAFTFLEFIIVGISILIVLNQIDISSFQPMFNLELIKYVQSTHVILTIPIGETVVFLMLSPNIEIDKKKITKYWFGGIAMGVGTMFFVMLRDIGVLGNTMHLFQLPGLITLRLANLGEAFSRMEILFAAALMFLMFFKVSLLLYISAKSVSSFFKIKSMKNLALILGTFVILLSMTLFSDPVFHSESAKEHTVFVWTLLEILIPILLFIVALIRKLPKQEEKQKEENKTFEFDSLPNDFKKKKSRITAKKNKQKAEQV